MRFVTLLSDFGAQDGYVAAMKGVILSLAPDARLIDVTHEIKPGDIEAGAWILSQYWRLFPAGSVHLAVVDPGVGSSRRAMALERDERYFVLPDNGLVSRVIENTTEWRCVELVERRFMRPEVSLTFHGRDVFAPVAAHLASGVPLDAFGPPLREPTLLAITPPVSMGQEIWGHISHVDRFGNLISDIPAAWVREPGAWSFTVSGNEVGRLRSSYSDVPKGALLALIGSQGTVEIAAREDSAADRLGCSRGETIVARAEPRAGRSSPHRGRRSPKG